MFFPRSHLSKCSRASTKTTHFCLKSFLALPPSPLPCTNKMHTERTVCEWYKQKNKRKNEPDRNVGKCHTPPADQWSHLTSLPWNVLEQFEVDGAGEVVGGGSPRPVVTGELGVAPVLCFFFVFITLFCQGSKKVQFSSRVINTRHPMTL